MNPFILGRTSIDTADTQKEFREYAYDFKKNSFIYNANGSHKIVSRNDALKVWIYKAILTERYKYRAYFNDYGAELEHFVGTVVNDGREAVNLFRYVEEALLVNPYIKYVDDIDIKQNKKIISMHLDITTIYGKSTLDIEV